MERVILPFIVSLCAFTASANPTSTSADGLVVALENFRQVVAESRAEADNINAELLNGGDIESSRIQGQVKIINDRLSAAFEDLWANAPAQTQLHQLPAPRIEGEDHLLGKLLGTTIHNFYVTLKHNRKERRLNKDENRRSSVRSIQMTVGHKDSGQRDTFLLYKPMLTITSTSDGHVQFRLATTYIKESTPCEDILNQATIGSR